MKLFRLIAASVILFIIPVMAGKRNGLSEIYEEFNSVPDSTRTKVWWFHGETPSTHEGITADLEAFRSAGVGGVVFYDQVHGDGAGADSVFSHGWWDSLVFSASEARRLGLTFEINLSNGFVAGGPWITPEMSMKRLCMSEITVDGGVTVDTVMPRPATGEFYDVKVLAFPVADGITPDKISIADGLLASENDTVVVKDFGRQFTARAITYTENTRSKARTVAMNIPGAPADSFYGDGYVEMPPIGELEVSQDGVNYSVAAVLQPLYSIHRKIKTITFPSVTGRYFRLNLHGWNRPDGLNRHRLELRDVTLTSLPMIDDYEIRAGYVNDYISIASNHSAFSSDVAPVASVTDITSFMDSAGRLQWTAPSSGRKWVVIRVAQTPTGGRTKHGRRGQMGPECDKMLPEAARLQWDNFDKVIIDSLSSLGLKPQGVIMDSHEMGAQNWTFGYEDEFLRLNGYDITPYLPALLGYAVGKPDEIDRVLLDHRRTLSHLTGSRYFATLDSLAEASGVMLTAQAMGNNHGMPVDNIAIKGYVRRPQGEFWAKHAHGAYDIKEAASAAHLYGRPVASAEAFTDARFCHSLAYLKSLADYAFSYQINELVVCASAAQPRLDSIPGNTAGGREYCLNRNNTLWPLSRGFWDYQARCAYMMRQGMPAVDLCIYAGSQIPMKLLSYRLPDIPAGYSWDICTDHALFGSLSPSAGGLLTSSGGVTYQALVIERDAELTTEAERRVNELAMAGVRIYDGRRHGSFRLGEFLDSAGIRPDVESCSGNRFDARILSARRSLPDGEIYFLVNHNDSTVTDTYTFRSAGGQRAEFWNPVDGSRRSLPVKESADGRASVFLTFAPYEAGFVVLRRDSVDVSLLCRNVAGKCRSFEIMIDSVTFFLPAGPLTLHKPEPESWTCSPDERIRHHSGRAVYSAAFQSPDIKPGERLFLIIEGLEGASEVEVNGRNCGQVWCAPYEVDITDAINTEAENVMRISVVNQLTNRMIGDLSLPPDRRVTRASTPVVKPGDPLLPAGITRGIRLEVRECGSIQAGGR